MENKKRNTDISILRIHDHLMLHPQSQPEQVEVTTQGKSLGTFGRKHMEICKLTFL